MNGSDVLLLVNTGDETLPVWTVVGSQTGVTFDESNATIDVSHKTSRAAFYEYGRYSSTVSLDALYVPDDAAYTALRSAARQGDVIKARRQEAGTDTEEATALITSMSQSFPDQGAATISVSLQITGEWAPAV